MADQQTLAPLATEPLLAPGDHPTAIVVEPGPASMAPAKAAAAPAAVPAPEAPTGATIPPGASLAQLEAPSFVLQVQLGRRSIPLSCTSKAVWALVLSEWMAAGFDGVVEARQAIYDAFRRFGTELRKEESRAGAAHGELNRNQGLYDSRPRPEYARDVETWRGAARTADQAVRKAAGTAADAYMYEPRYDAFFRDAWSQLAVLEEALLKEWEALAHDAFQELMKQNAANAEAEWTKYGVYHKDDAQKVVDIKKANGDPEDFRFGLKAAKETDPDPLAQLRSDALEVKRLARQIASTKANLDRVVEDAERKGGDATRHRALRLAAIQDQIIAWKAKRDEVRKSDPAVLRIYPDVWTKTTLEEFRTMLVETLLASYRESTVLHTVEAQRRLLSQGDLRMVPRQDGQNARPKDPARLAALGVGQVGNAYEKFRLTVPASAVLVEKLKRDDNSKYTPWLHLPVRLKVWEKVEKGGSRWNFNDETTMEGAVLCHLFDWLEKSRQSDKHARMIASLTVFIEGAVLAPFTFGGSLVVAGWIAAAFAFEELYRAVEEHKQAEVLASTEMRRELLPMELEAVEIALWTQPSRVELVRMVTSKTIDAGLNLVPANQIKFLTSLAVMAVSMALAPAERKTLSQQDLDKRAKSAQRAAQAKAAR